GKQGARLRVTRLLTRASPQQLFQCNQVLREDFYFNHTNTKRRNIMIRKTLFVIAGAISLATLITAGLTLGLPAKATTSAAATPAAVQGCSFTIPINRIDVGN